MTKPLKKKIVFIIPRLGGGGAEKMVLNIINSLDKAKFELTLMVISTSEDYSKLVDDHIKLIFLQRPNLRSALIPIYKNISKISPDIVFTSLSHINTFNVLLRKVSGLKYKAIIRLAIMPNSKTGKGVRSNIDKFLNRILFRHATSIIAQTKEMRDDAIRLYHISPSKILHIPNIINMEQINRYKDEKIEFDRDEYNLISAGRLVHIKGYDILIEALSLVKKVIPKVRLHLLGQENNEIGYKNKLQQLIHAKGLDHNVTFHGFQINPYKFFQKADVFVLPSREEGFPNVVLEALALGTPVVVSNCVNFDGIVEENVNGLIVPVGDVNLLADAIIKAKDLKIGALKIGAFDYTSFFDKF